MDADDDLANEIEAQVNEWSTPSNECFTIHLRKGEEEVASFQPEFTYEFFGEEQAIFGYQALAIDLTFDAHDMRPSLKISHKKVFPAVSENIKPTDIRQSLEDFLPQEAFAERASSSESESNFAPPGEKLHAFLRNGERYEIRCASLADPAARGILENMQILVPMFIEGGSLLQLEQRWSTERWKLFLLYHTHERADANISPYTLAGFGTSYRVFTLPKEKDLAEEDKELLNDTPLESFLAQSTDPEGSSPSDRRHPLDLPSRERLSQFLILPPFQGQGHGKQLYATMYNHLTSDSNVLEFTVEDPNEAFDDLRDACDLHYLRRHHPEFRNLRINTNIPTDRLLPAEPIPTSVIVDAAVRDWLRKKTKIEPRQFGRLVEMHTLSQIPPRHRNRARITKREKASDENDRAYYFWRLYVKERLYLHNRDQLIQVAREERVERLEAALDSVQEGYEKMLEKVGKAEDEDGEDEAVTGASAAQKAIAASRKRRKVVEEDEEEEEEADEAANGHKKFRSSED